MDIQYYIEKIGKGLFDILEIIVVAFAIFAVIYLFITSPHEVIGKSMEPNYYEGEFLLADKVTYRFRDPKHGEVIILRYDDSHDYIKRVVGVPGDTISILSGRVYLNSELLDESEYLDSSVETLGGSYLPEGKTTTVPEGEFFVLGDNRPHSSDSRSFGPITKSQIKGRTVFRLTPLNRFGGVI